MLAIQEASKQAEVGWTTVGAAIGVPIVIYMISLWLLYVRIPTAVGHRWLIPAASVLVLAAMFAPMPVLLIGLTLAGMLCGKVWLRVRSHNRAEATAPAESIRA